MTIELVTERNIGIAAEVHSISWKDSHKSFCSADFIEAHTTERQRKYIEQEIQRGKQFYLLSESGQAKGIVSVQDSLIENLYVLPAEQRKGYGTALLQYAEKRCSRTPTLWILSNNTVAENLYQKFGYEFTGNVKPLKNDLQEMEMQRSLGKEPSDRINLD
jgi:GNAT superfamily N-acetyltransferase